MCFSVGVWCVRVCVRVYYVPVIRFTRILVLDTHLLWHKLRVNDEDVVEYVSIVLLAVVEGHNSVYTRK